MGTPRVLIVIAGFYPLIGGAEKQGLELCKELRKSGIETQVLTFQLQPEWPTQEEIEGVPVTRMQLPGIGLRGLANLTLFCHLLRGLGEYDIIHNLMVSTYTTVCVVVGKLFDKPVVVKLANSGQRNDLLLVSQSTPWPVSQWVRRSVLAVDAIVAICSVIRDELLEYSVQEERIYSIPNGVDLDFYAPADEMLRCKRRHELNLPQDVCTVLRVGTLMPKKGVEVLFEAWKQIADCNPDALLLSVGGYPEEVRQQLTQPWGNRVHFVPNTDNVLPYYQAADIFVLPSFAEGLSNALLEAQACGLPSVVTRVGGNPEVVNHGENGLVVEPGDVDGLAAALKRLVDSHKLRIQMGQRAREKSQRYAMSGVVQQYITLYQQLVNRKRHK